MGLRTYLTRLGGSFPFWGSAGASAVSRQNGMRRASLGRKPAEIGNTTDFLYERANMRAVVNLGP